MTKATFILNKTGFQIWTLTTISKFYKLCHFVTMKNQ